MGLLDILKAAMGLETRSQTGSTTTTDSPQQDVDVTVEHEPEPDTTSEDAVKGTGEEESEPAAETETEEQDEAEPEQTEADESEAAEAEAEPEDEPETSDLENADDAVDSIKGIGPSYADKLNDAGVETVGDLVSMGAEAIAAESEISEKRAQRWIDRAQGEE
jgi:predicted flap endonuclease-1-like 5' DNA nuclease